MSCDSPRDRVLLKLQDNPHRRCTLRLTLLAKPGTPYYFTGTLQPQGRPFESIVYVNCAMMDARLEQYEGHFSLWMGNASFELSAEEAHLVTATFGPHGLRSVSLPQFIPALQP